MYNVMVYTLLIGLYVLHRLFPSFIPEHIIGAVSILALIVSLRKTSGLYMLSGLFFLIFGILLFFFHQLPFQSIFLQFDSMLGLLSLFFMLPFINAFIHVGRFDISMSRLLYLNVQKPSHIYRRGSLVTHLLGIFLNITTIPLLVKSLDYPLASTSDQVKHRFYARNLLRAYALCLTWSPLEVMVSTSVDALGVKYYQIFPFMFLLAVLFLAVDWFIFSHRKDYPLKLHTCANAPVKSANMKKLMVHLIGFLFLFVVAVSIVDHLTGQGFLFSVVLSILPYSLISSAFMGKAKQYLRIALSTWKTRTGNLSNYFFMFLSAGFFVETLSQTPWLITLQKYLSGYTDQTLLLYLIVGGYFLVTSLIGFHPLVSLVLLLSIMHPFIEELASVSFALVIIGSSLATVMYSPFNVSVSILSDLIRVHPFYIMVQNIGFAVLYVLTTIFLGCLTYWLHVALQ